MDNVTLRTQPAYRLAAFSHQGAYHEIGGTFDKLGQWSCKEGLMKPDGIVIGIYYDDPSSTPEDQLRSDACFVIPDDYEPKDPAHLVELPGGEYAIYRHVGPYSGLGEAWRRMYAEWLPQSGREHAPSMSYELYVNSPAVTPPEELVTEICVPLKPAQKA